MADARAESEAIEIVFDRDFCHRHLRYFKRHWPKGSAMFSILVFSAFVRLDQVIGFSKVGDSDLGDTDRIPLAMKALGPMCCAIDHRTVREIRAFALNPIERNKTDRVRELLPPKREDSAG